MDESTQSPQPGDYVPASSYERLKARYERLMEISKKLNSTLDLGVLLRYIVDAATELTNTELASILLIDPSTGQLRFEASSNLSRAEMEAIPVPLDSSLAGWVVTHDEPVLVADARSDRRWFPRVDKTTKVITRNLLAVPMDLQNKPIGVVEAINRRGNTPWNEDDVSTLLMLANQAAIAIQNARLFQQSDFIAEMAHELRTPLAALRASSSLLLRPNLPPDVREEIARTMQQETERLTVLTNDFLDLARLESGRSRLESTLFDLRALLDECITLVRPRAAERNISIEVSGPAVAAQADRNKIKQVLLNLLTNAIKYNREAGAVRCSVEHHRGADDSPPWLSVSVEDTGHGISPEHQGRVFEKFFRAPETASDIPGTGLGLVISKRIAEAHGGDLWFESELGVGTTFTLRIPAPDQITGFGGVLS